MTEEKKRVNKGEQNEILFKAFLLQEMNEKRPVGLLGLIESLDFGGGYETPKWNPRYSKLIINNDYEALNKILPKAPPLYKADLGINGKNYSLKYTGAAKPAIVNHTSRKGFKRVCEQIGVEIETLDSIITEYWEKREAGIISEDVKNSDPNSPFKSHMEYLTPILKYFLFEGTAGKDSKFPADFVLEFSNATDPKTYIIHTKGEVVKNLWDKLVFSIRSKKGMPRNYDPKEDPDIAPWVRYIPGKPDPKGALHIRS